MEDKNFNTVDNQGNGFFRIYPNRLDTAKDYKVGALSQDASHASIAVFVNYIVGIVVALLIAWYAWKWPKQQE